jgi:hypothetical protein
VTSRVTLPGLAAGVRVPQAGRAATQAFRDNLVLDCAGISATELSTRQRELLLEVIRAFVDNMTEGHARVRMDEVQQHLDDTHFAWIGAADGDAVFYYRVQSPVILIEFDHQTPVALEGPCAVAPPRAQCGSHAERQRLRQGSPAPALRASQPARLSGAVVLARVRVWSQPFSAAPGSRRAARRAGM